MNLRDEMMLRFSSPSSTKRQDINKDVFVRLSANILCSVQAVRFSYIANKLNKYIYNIISNTSSIYK